MSNLNERRAEFIYDGARLAAIAANAPIVPELWTDREEDFKEQFRKVIFKQCSDARETDPARAHQTWMDEYFRMGWVYGKIRNTEKRTHPDLVPFDELEQREQDKDAVFLALCEIARQWIY